MGCPREIFGLKRLHTYTLITTLEEHVHRFRGLYRDHLPEQHIAIEAATKPI